MLGPKTSPDLPHESFEAMSSTGEIEIAVRSSTMFPANYALGVNCGDKVTVGAVPMVSLGPNEEQRVLEKGATGRVFLLS